MSKQRDTIKEIFDHAAELDSVEQRGMYLSVACHGDEQVRRQVESLLEAYDQAHDFLESPPALSNSTEQPGDETLGTSIGPFVLREVIGEGGMGIVYVAEQTAPIARKVAFKIIKPGMDTNQVVARFEAERQALALMDDPNIAKVLDAGSTTSGRPYFVMELVRGLPITEYCDQYKLNVHQRLDLFTTVCHAVQHAHQKGIIHRDLKPTNVLVTRNGDRAVPKVIDFGVAKAMEQKLTERTVYTKLNQMVGTPLYMSPEQAELSELDVDTRSDIYSLGVLLYELLTGSTPFSKQQLKSASFDEIRRIIREDEPPAPSVRVSTLNAEVLSTISDQRRCEPFRLNSQIRGELDWIVMKALEKDRRRRYDTASALADDVRRHLEGDVVEARPPTRLYRFTKLAKRYRAWIITSALIAASLLAGFTATTWQWYRARTAEALAKSQAELADRAANAAVLRDDAEAETLSRQVLQEQEERLGRDHPSTILSLNRLGLILDSQGRLQAGEAQYREAIQRLDANGRALDATTLKVLDNLATNLDAQGRYAEVEAIRRRLLTAHETLDTSHEQRTDAKISLGVSLANQFKYEQAIEVYNDAIRIETSGSQRPDTLKALKWAIAQCERKLTVPVPGRFYERGVGLARNGQWRQALADFQESLRLAPEVGLNWFVVGLASLQAEDLQGYREHCQSLVADRSRIKDRNDAAWIADTLVLHADSVRDWPAVLSLAGPLLNDSDAGPAEQVRYASLLYRAGDHEGTIAMLEPIVSAHPEFGTARFWLALAYDESQRVEAARDEMRQAWIFLRKSWPGELWYVRERDAFLLRATPDELWDGQHPYSDD